MPARAQTEVGALAEFMILIVTISGDLHALRIQQVLRDRGFGECHILECDRLATDCRVSATLGANPTAEVVLADGTRINVREIDLIWWRRVRADQELADMDVTPDARILINNDCRGALTGILTAAFRGKWISEPDATDRASNKIFQLDIAKRCGFRVPETLVSQSASDVAEFVESLAHTRVIVKPVVGVAGPIIFTQFLDDPRSLADESYRLAPALYQEYIAGTEHIRLNCFGDSSFAAVIESADLDWRPNLNVPIKTWTVPAELHTRVRRVLDQLGLAMGIIDLKITPQGEFVWFEVNPQGQFLFLEGLTRVPLSDYFADYLLANATTVPPAS